MRGGLIAWLSEVDATRRQLSWRGTFGMLLGVAVAGVGMWLVWGRAHSKAVGSTQGVPVAEPGTERQGRPSPRGGNSADDPAARGHACI